MTRLSQKEIQQKYFNGNKYSPYKSEMNRASYKQQPNKVSCKSAVERFNNLFKARA